MPGTVSWRVDRVIGSSLQHTMEACTVRLGFDLVTSAEVTDARSSVLFDMPKAKFEVLHAELKRAAQLMAAVAPE